MPPVGGFVALCVNNRGPTFEAQKTKIYGDFFKIEITPNSDTITGKLMINFNAYRICHGGIKVQLRGILELIGRNGERSWKPITKHCPTETILSCGDLLHGQKRLSFSLKIPPHQSYPTPFMSSNGSLTYKIVACIARDGLWEVFAKKLVSFKGYYNVLHMDMNPFVESKIMKMKTGEVESTFRVPNTVAVMGKSEGLEAILELHGLLDNHVDATLTFFRKVSCGGNIHTEIILTQTRNAEIHQSNALFKWTVVVPMMKRCSYSGEFYSVRYYLKYEVILGQIGVQEHHAAVNGVAEIEIGTSRDSAGCTLQDNMNGVTNQNRSEPQANRRKSVMSLVSMLSLPPAYSQLVSRSGSMISLETQPPKYEELKE